MNAHLSTQSTARTCIRRWAFILVALGAVGLQAAGAASQGAQPGSPVDRIVAVVENDVITQSELDARTAMIQRQYADKRDKLPPPGQLREQVLQRLVIERLQLNMAKRHNIKIDEVRLDDAMRRVAGRNGMRLDEFRDKLVAEGIDYVHFRQQVQNEMMISQLRKRVLNQKIQITQQEVDNLLNNDRDALEQKTEYRLANILISVPEAATPKQIESARKKAEQVHNRLTGGADFAQTAISVSDSNNALDGGDLGWRGAAQVPSIFASQISAMEAGDISPVIRSPSGFHIVQLTDKRGEEKDMVKQSRIRHILVKTNAIVDDEEARIRLENLRNRIEQGEDFQAMARANSADKVSAIEGGSLGWMNPSDLSPRFTEVVASLEPGEISQPFKTQAGWHIVQLLKRRMHDSTEQVMRAKARKYLRQQKAQEETELWLRRLRDESYVDYRTGSNRQG